MTDLLKHVSIPCLPPDNSRGHNFLRRSFHALALVVFSCFLLIRCSGITGNNTPPSSARPQLSVTPSSVSFGNVVVGTTNIQTIRLINSGTANLTISQATVSGSSFTISGLTPPLTLSAGQGTNFNTAFAPPGVGSIAGSVSLVTNVTNSPTTIALSGTGVAAISQLTASPTSLNFGNVTVGSSATQTVTLTNTGNSSVSISQVNASGVGFSTSGVTPPLTLPAGQSTGFSVTFGPATPTSSTGSVTVASNATNSPAIIALSGTGAQASLHSVSLTWVPSASVVAGYNVYRSPQSGGPYTILNSLLALVSTYVDSTVQSGQTYFYVVTAVDSSNIESPFSNEVSATIP